MGAAVEIIRKISAQNSTHYKCIFSSVSTLKDGKQTTMILIRLGAKSVFPDYSYRRRTGESYHPSTTVATIATATNTLATAIPVLIPAPPPQTNYA